MEDVRVDTWYVLMSSGTWCERAPAVAHLHNLKPCPMTKAMGCTCGISISPTQSKKSNLKSTRVFNYIDASLKVVTLTTFSFILPSSREVFSFWYAALSMARDKGADMVKRLGGIIVFKIEDEADLTVTVSDENFVKLTKARAHQPCMN
eukprot:868945-Prorocentrum_minimum.AAC.5